MTKSKSYELTRYRSDSQESEHALGNEDAESGGKDSIQERPSWTRGIDFFMACLGGSVGLGNVWKFPYLCYKNGGGAFLIPYFITMLMASLPIFIMEVGIGQYMGKGAHNAWGIVPLFQGLGLAGVVIVFYINSYYNVILSWALMYLFHSFASPLPWDSCDGSWNTDRCVADYTKNTSRSGRNDSSISSFATNNSSSSSSSNSNITRDSNVTTVVADSVTEFWE